MTKLQRFANVLAAVLMLACVVVLMTRPEEGYSMVVTLLSLSMIVWAVRRLYFYFMMAKHMVAGRIHLYMGVIVLDLGMFTLTLSDIPQFYILLYLLGFHAFSGLVDLLRAKEAKGYGSPYWKYRMIEGIVNILIAVACVAFLRSPKTVTYIYCIGLVYSAVTRLVSAFRRTAIIYIQ